MLAGKQTKQTLLPYVKHIVNTKKDYRMQVEPTNETYLFSKGFPQLVHKLEDFKWFVEQSEYEAFLAEGPMTNTRYAEINKSLHETLDWASENKVASGDLV